MNSEETALIIESTSTSLFCFVSSLTILLEQQKGACWRKTHVVFIRLQQQTQPVPSPSHHRPLTLG